MSMVSEFLKKITLKKVVDSAVKVVVEDVVTGKDPSLIVNDILADQKNYLLTSTISEFCKAVENNETLKILCSLYVDINYAKEIMNSNPEKAKSKLNYVLKQLDDSCKLIKDGNKK